MFKRRPFLHYAAGLMCAGLGFFAVSLFFSASTLARASIGCALLLLPLGAVLYHELS